MSAAGENGTRAPVVVIGDGFAGMAAAFAATRAGRSVCVVASGIGASDLASGALDDRPWEEVQVAWRALRGPVPLVALPDGVTDVIEALGGFALPAPGELRPWLATTAGRVRPARGHDRALLDLAPLRDTTIVLPRADRAGWDADAIAASLASEPWARARGLAFEAIDLAILRHADERRISDLDLAARHDDERRLAWLAGRMREHLGKGAGAVLFGPWLGASAPRAEALSALVGLPCGEALAGVGSPSGLRLAAARERLFDQLGVERIRARATRLEDTEHGLVVHLEGGGTRHARAVVLTVGGLAGGGVVYDPPEHVAGADLPARGRVPFALSLEADVELALRGEPLDVVSSLHGPVLDEDAWPVDGRTGALEAVGVRCEGARVVRRDGRSGTVVLAAGDVVADRPRTALEAVASGVRAGALAAGR